MCVSCVTSILHNLSRYLGTWEALPHCPFTEGEAGSGNYFLYKRTRNSFPDKIIATCHQSVRMV